MTATTTRHTAATRRVILDAAVSLFLERRSDDFSVQEVADRAGLTHRTVYRYFPTRQELLAATANHIAPSLAEEPFTSVSTVEDWINAMGAHLARTEDNLTTVRKLLAAILASDDLRLFGGDTDDRDAHRRETVRRQFPHLTDDDARQTFATLRHLMSSASYVLFRLRFGMSPEEATKAISDAALEIVKQAGLRDGAARRARRARSADGNR